MRTFKIYSTIALAFALGSCGKYLEKEPDNRAKLTDPAKVSALLGSAYPVVNYMAFNEAMSDNADDKGTGGTDATNHDPYYFENVQSTEQDSPDSYWNGCYTAIAAANQALEACELAPDPENYKMQKAEALVVRAYSHFMLVTLYSKPYDAATAASNPGVPYVTVPETVVIKDYSRQTVKYVYDMIEKDLIAGLPGINDVAYTVPRYHFNRSAANAFAARFYLYKKDYTKALQYATASVPNLLPNLRKWNTTYLTYGLNNLPSEYQKSTDPANLLLVTAVTNYNYGNRFATYRYGLSVAKKDEIFFTPQSLTRGEWCYLNAYVGSQSNPAIPKLNYTDFAYASPTVDYGLGYGNITLFSTEEVLFNKAEANAYLGNYTAAINDLNTFLSTRILGVTPGALPSANAVTEAKLIAHYNGTKNTQDALVAFILELKRLDFIHEGMRWFDNLRYGTRIVHNFRNGSAVTGSITIESNDKRRQLKLPDGVKLSGINDLNR